MRSMKLVSEGARSGGFVVVAEVARNGDFINGFVLVLNLETWFMRLLPTNMSINGRLPGSNKSAVP
jgi:hypothetical protein